MAYSRSCSNGTCGNGAGAQGSGGCGSGCGGSNGADGEKQQRRGLFGRGAAKATIMTVAASELAQLSLDYSQYLS